jgi:hypothetical protein
LAALRLTALRLTALRLAGLRLAVMRRHDGSAWDALDVAMHEARCG